MSDLKGLISIARKAGYVVIGQENLVGYDKKLYLLILDKTAGKSLEREITFLAKRRALPLLRVENLGEILKIDNCKVIGIRNKNLSEEIERILKGE